MLKVFVVFIITLLVVELAGHGIYRFLWGQWLWQQDPLEVFNIRTFTEFVPDDRVITNRKAFYSQLYSYEFDQNGFRVGSHEYDKSSSSIIFLGDSVPFGWGLDSTQTVPSQFSKEMQKNPQVSYGVINAAVPSYSLHQAVERYRQEIAGRYPVHLLVLQIFDPASQLSTHGSRWVNTMNWSTNNLSPTLTSLKQSAWYRYSILLHTLADAWVALSAKEKGLNLSDTETRDRFITENQADLSALLAMVREDGGKLVLLPVNPADSYLQALEQKSESSFIHAIDWLNTAMSTFAQEHEDVFFFDVAGYFDQCGRSGYFIDECCHLSVMGAEVQAKFLYRELLEKGLLE